MLRTNHENCSGCSACYNICPTGAINMIQKEDGFLYPSVDNEKCTKCGLCNKVCEKLNLTNFKNPVCYGAMAEDEERLKGSSSGAVFPIIAKYVIEKGGYVAGAIYDENWTVKHFITNNLEGVEKIRGSKYVQSSIGESYKKIKELLDQGELCLFTGTPCQVGGLKNYLEKDYENLLLVDIVCHGAPSPKVFEKYLNENFDKQVLKNINHRSKINGWSQLYTTTTTTTGDFIAERSHANDYLKSFLYNLSVRESCFNCKYQTIPRQGDLTIGDFWGVEKYNEKLNDGRGISIILENNNKGKDLLEKIGNRFKFLEKVPIELVIENNPNLVSSSKPHKNRKEFFENLDKMSLKENLEYVFDEKVDCMVLNLWFAVNYGAILTCYGLYKLLLSLGFKTKVINYKTPFFKELIQGSFAEKFAKEHLDLTEECDSLESLQKLNDKTENFIVGSDQLWKSSIYKNHGRYIYHLNFVWDDKRKIGYSVSFGDKKFDGGHEDKKFSKYYLEQFDKISVREKGGVEILKELGIESDLILDPVFALDKKEWEELANKNIEDKNYIACYSLSAGYFGDDIPYIKELLRYAKEKLSMDSISLKIKDNYSVEEWLSYMNNSKFVITDSHHGVCFAIIFNKPFLFVDMMRGASDRFDTLFELLDIKGRVIRHNELFNKRDDIFEPMDYEKINRILEEQRSISKKWLKEALAVEIKKQPIEKEVMNLLLLNEEMRFEEKTKQPNKTKLKVKPLEKIFSLKNYFDGKRHYKVVHIFGIKIKFRKKDKV